MRSFHYRPNSFLLPFILLTSFSALGQVAPAPPQWETLRPEGEEFSVLMPKGSTFETSKEPYHKMELSTRTYLHNTKPGPVFAVVSLSGIKSNPALYTEMQRINSYVDAFKTFFAPKIRKDMIAKLTLVGEKTLQGNAGREYRMTIGDLSGTAQVFATRKRFYSIVYLNTKKDDALEEKFLSSFVVPERQVEQPKVAEQTAQPNAEDPSVVKPDRSQGVPAETDPNQQPGTDNRSDAGVTNPPNTPQPQPNAGAKKGPIAGGVLNGKAIYMPTPEVPGGEASGVVLVSVLVDEQGSVVEARAISGPAHLHNAAVSAARLARFSPTLLMGEPVRVSGTLSYNFSKSN